MTAAPGPASLPTSDLPPPAWWSSPWFLALLGWSIIICFFALPAPVGMEITDCWVAQTAREMSAATSLRDYLVPHFAGEVRLQKSPGAYWAVLLISTLRGAPVDEFAVRVPNAIAAVLLIVTTYWLTRRIAGGRSAIFAGFAMSASVFTLNGSHSGSSDLGMTALNTLGLALWFVGCEYETGRRQRLLWLLGYFFAGCAMLYKMPMPLVCIGLPALGYLLIRRKWRLLLDPMHLVGLLLFVLPWLPWIIGVLLVEPTAWDKWLVEFWQKPFKGVQTAEEHRRWIWYLYYLACPFWFALPFSLSIPLAIARGWRTARSDPSPSTRAGIQFALIWILSLLVFFSIPESKEWRYFLPAMPAVFILLGCELAAFFDSDQAQNTRRAAIGARSAIIALPLVFIAGGFAINRWFKEVGRYDALNYGELMTAYIVAAVILSCGFILAALLYARRREGLAFAAMVATMYAAWFWIWPSVMPYFQRPRALEDFAAQLRNDLPADLRSRLRMVSTHDARITWYSDIRFPRVVDQLELLKRMGGSRHDADREKRIIGEEMIRQLESRELALFVASRFDYLYFLTRAPAELEKAGRKLPPVHIWLQTRIGAKSRQYILFSNQPPPWPEQPLTPPSETFDVSAFSPPATAPSPSPQSKPASNPSTDGDN